MDNDQRIKWNGPGGAPATILREWPEPNTFTNQKSLTQGQTLYSNYKSWPKRKKLIVYQIQKIWWPVIVEVDNKDQIDEIEHTKMKAN